MNKEKMVANRKKIAELKAENVELEANLYRGNATIKEAIDFNNDWISELESANNAYMKMIGKIYE